MSFLSVSNIFKSFNTAKALDGVSFELEKGQIHCFLGPSGCGKTTLLRIIAGLETADKGTIFFNGKNLKGKPIHKRNFGMMFQHFALFPHKNVFSNISFGLEMQGLSQNKIEKRVFEMLTLTGMTGYENREVQELSGGEKQRVALARTLAPRPSLLLLDEPLGALDRVLRERLLIDLHSILKEVEIPAIFVTHDQSEAFAIADNISVFNKGKIIQTDTPVNLFNKPQNEDVALFLGMNNIIEGTVIDYKTVITNLGKIVTNNIPSFKNKGDSVKLLLPTDSNVEVSNSTNTFSGKIINSWFKGRYCHVKVKPVNNDNVLLNFDLKSQVPKGSVINFSIDPARITVFE